MLLETEMAMEVAKTIIKMIIRKGIEEDGIISMINNLTRSIQIRIQIPRNKTVSQMKNILANLERENSTNSKSITIKMNRNHMSGTVNSCNGKENSENPVENSIKTARDMTKTAHLVKNLSLINRNHINWSHVNQIRDNMSPNPEAIRMTVIQRNSAMPVGPNSNSLKMTLKNQLSYKNQKKLNLPKLMSHKNQKKLNLPKLYDIK
jgi:hypothetical protein